MKTPVLNIAPGKTVDYHGEPCLVLEHRKDGTLMLHLDQMTHAFGSSNNFAASSLRSHLNGPYLRSLTDGNPDEIITRTVNLTALNGSKEYGTCECKVAPLTLDELRKYHDILPLPESFEWSVTPWSTPEVNEDDKWVMGLFTNGNVFYYEINRGLCVQQTSGYEFIEVYCPEVAERRYREFLKEKGRDLKIGKDHALARRLEELVMVHGFAPGAALAEIRNNGEVYDTVICENTLYNYIYRGDVFLQLTPEHLHNKGRRHYAANSKRQAARSSNGKSIETRPQEVKARGSFGHWEMDSIMGCKGSKKALLVLTERRTRMGIVMLLEDHTAASVVKAINRLERRFGKLFYKLFKSITVDNGCEFQDFEGIEAAHRRKGKRTVVFFCHPYSAFERGSNENMNRLIRRFFPKGTSFDTVTPEEVRAAEKWVNSYPRKLLGWQSAATLFEKELLSA